MINEILKKLNSKINGNLIYLSQFGSHLYGLNTENSDLDFRGVYIPTLDDTILKKDKDEINTEIVLEEAKFTSARKITDSYGFVHCLKESKETKEIKVDVKIFSLQKFIQLCSKADTNALDLLFSIDTPADHTWQYKGLVKNVPEEMKYPLRYIHENKDKLINTDRLESPITYAFKQATKYSIKGERRQVMLDLLKDVNNYLFLDTTPADVPLSRFMTDFTYQNGTPVINQYIDGKHVKIDILNNKGKKEKYLYVCGVQHQFNLELKKFAQRLEEKIKKEYTSQRTIDAADGNDWKALSHAIRVLLEIKELLDTGNIQFPLKDKDFLLDIKLGKVERKDIDEFFNKELSEILERVQKNELNWKYNEEFWNKFILSETKK